MQGEGKRRSSAYNSAGNAVIIPQILVTYELEVP